MVSYRQFMESAAEMANKAMADKQQKFKADSQAAVEKTKADNERRQMNVKRAKLRAKMKARGVEDDDGLLDDED